MRSRMHSKSVSERRPSQVMRRRSFFRNKTEVSVVSDGVTDRVEVS